MKLQFFVTLNAYDYLQYNQVSSRDGQEYLLYSPMVTACKL